ncbi:MAG: hypothetical protein OXH63_01930 [Gemmatimonadetes bacterium]|nr:hypothetical protein [Gemmatimonadota bacterium]
MNASVRELKSRLSCYLRQVQLAILPGINAGTGEKPRGATRPMRVKPGQKSVADIVVEERR